MKWLLLVGLLTSCYQSGDKVVCRSSTNKFLPATVVEWRSFGYIVEWETGVVTWTGMCTKKVPT